MQIDLEDMIREVSNKVLYIHRKASDNTIFYVGIGNPSRPYNFHQETRSAFWQKTAAKHGVIVEVLEENLTPEKAIEKEIYLIKKIGRRDTGEGTLVNHTDGGGGTAGFRNRVIDINTGDVYLNVSVYARYKKIPISSVNYSLENSYTLPIRKLSNEDYVQWGKKDIYFSAEENEPTEPNEDIDKLIRQIKSYLINNKK